MIAAKKMEKVHYVGMITGQTRAADPAQERVSEAVAIAPDPEVKDKAIRRRFTAEYKLRILNQADACIETGGLGELLRREGLYASNLNTWRSQRERGVLSGLTPKKRGRKESVRDPLRAENEKLRKENERLANRLRQAEIIIDIQKKVSQILGIPLATPGEGGAD
jgi:transposase-like protein